MYKGVKVGLLLTMLGTFPVEADTVTLACPIKSRCQADNGRKCESHGGANRILIELNIPEKSWRYMMTGSGGRTYTEEGKMLGISDSSIKMLDEPDRKHVSKHRLTMKLDRTTGFFEWISPLPIGFAMNEGNCKPTTEKIPSKKMF